MSKTPSKPSSTRMMMLQRKKKLEKEARAKPFGFCCSVDRFDPLSRYDQQMPPYKSSLTAITSVHECPVSKIQTEFLTPRISREKKRLPRIKTSVMDKQQLSKNDRSNYLRTIDRRDRFLRWCLEDEIAIARDIFWTEKQRIYDETGEKAIAIAKKKEKSKINLLDLKYPRWYQDLSPDQMKNLMNLENTMRADYEETITSGTQTTLMAIGVISTFFKLKPKVIRELHGSCNLNSVEFLREVYRLLTGNDFQKEDYKKSYNCNERLILSAIAFLTLPEIVEELHKRLPAVIMPRLPPKPKPPICPPRQKSSYPYKEELFKCPDWVGYRHDLQEWRKRFKLITIPKVILPFSGYDQFLTDELREIDKKRGKNIYDKRLKEINMKELQKISADKFEQRDVTNIDRQIKHEDESLPSEKDLDVGKSETFDIPRLPDESKKFDFTITGLGEKLGAVEYKICGTLQPPGAKQKSWLGEKDPRYIIAGASEDPPSCPVTYEITGVANVTPSNSDERFFAVLKLDDGPRRIFPGGRENLSRNWQEWLRNADEEFRRVEKETNRLIENVRATTRLIFPGPICDDCCSCRQTRKTREKLRLSKTPYMLIDNILQDKDEKKYIVGSMAMHSPAPSPTGSAVNLLEMIASQEEIKTDVIINGVTSENGRTQYYISGVQKNKVHVPSRIPDPPAPESVRNVPPCACAIQQMFNENVNPSASKDNIPWTKDEGLCLGKKYRPDEPGAYSCKMYPGDKSCRRNPFAKDVAKMRKKKEEEGENGREKVETIEVVVEQTRVSEKKVTEKKRGRFIPDPDYPAYDDPWNISRTAPSEKVLETDYEKSLKLTPAALPAVPSPSRTQKKHKDISSTNKEPKKLQSREEVTIDEEVSRKIPSKSPRKVQGERIKERENAEDKKKKKSAYISSKSTTIDEKKGVKLPSKISKSAATRETRKLRTKLSAKCNCIKLSNCRHARSTRRQKSDKIDKARKREFAKRDRKKNVTDEADELDDRKREMTRLKNMLKSIGKVFDDVQPAVLPEERLTTSRLGPEEKSEEIGDSSVPINEEEDRRAAGKGPCGWRTRSEQELLAKKTVAYLCEPDYPLETVAIRPGGRPCQCRENRSKKKILMYNVSGLVDEKRDGRRTKKREVRKTKLEEENRIIDGVFYFTPPVSPRRSDEYVPEYELLQSPYDMCVNEAANESSKLIEKYSGPKSLVEKIRKKPKSCSCGAHTDTIAKEDGITNQKKEIKEARQKLMDSKSPEERWAIALKDKGLTDYLIESKDNSPCWTSCAKYKRSVRPRRLKMKKPVCECKYERKILERNEERVKWRTRQRKLKALKKQPFVHIVDTSRPMVPDTKFIISGVKRIPREDEYADDVKYCITGVAESLTMSPPERIIDSLKMSSPCETPVASREDIPRAAPHRHWSPMDIPPGPLPRRDAALKKEMEYRKRVRDEAFRMIYGEQDAAYRGCQEPCDQRKLTETIETYTTKRSDTSIKKRAPEALKKPHLVSSTKKIDDGKTGYRQEVPRKKIASEVTQREKRKRPKEVTGDTNYRQDASYRQIVGETGDNNDENHRNGDGDGEHPTGKQNLTAMMKVELKRMAAEGYVFAKLPKCHLMPQLQDWIMYRKGVAFSETDKKNLMQTTVVTWMHIEKLHKLPIKKPSLHMSKHQMDRLTYDRAEETKRKIKEMTALFHSDIRKSRVLYSRSMWSTMEFGRFPSTSFKRAFFTYMAGKEADGHVYKPWNRFEFRERDPKFIC